MGLFTKTKKIVYFFQQQIGTEDFNDKQQLLYFRLMYSNWYNHLLLLDKL